MPAPGPVVFRLEDGGEEEERGGKKRGGGGLGERTERKGGKRLEKREGIYRRRKRVKQERAERERRKWKEKVELQYTVPSTYCLYPYMTTKARVKGGGATVTVLSAMCKWEVRTDNTSHRHRNHQVAHIFPEIFNHAQYTKFTLELEEIYYMYKEKLEL